MNTYFTSDNHFGHARVIEYAKRPFSSLDEMNEAMITQWNSVVRPGDQIYHVGDFALCKPKDACNIVRRLNGQKFIVWGNHDRALRKDASFLGHWAWTKDLAEVTVADQKIILCHYAMRVWNKSHYGSWQLYGHSHGSLKDDPHALSLDVGVDEWNFTPVSFEEIRDVMKNKSWEPVDHHGKRDEDEE